VIADITREMGRRAGLPVAISPLPTASAVLQAVRPARGGYRFVAPNPERTGVVLYSQTYMLVQQSALVRADSPLRSVGELDRPGQVLGVNTDDSVGVWLQERLTAARVRPTPDYTLHDAVRWLQDGEVVAFAGGRQRIAAATSNVPGLRFWTTTSMACARQSPCRPTARIAWRWSTAALDEFRAAAFWPNAVARSGIDGLAVAPAR